MRTDKSAASVPDGSGIKHATDAEFKKRPARRRSVLRQSRGNVKARTVAGLTLRRLDIAQIDLYGGTPQSFHALQVESKAEASSRHLVCD